MKLKNFIVLFAAALIACETQTFAHQKAISSSIKPHRTQEQPAGVEFITPLEMKTKIEKSEPVVIVDVRGQSSYAQSDKRIKGAIHTKVRKAAYRLREIPPDREIITYCACPADEAAAIAAQALLAKGFKRVRVLKGGWNAWLKAGGQVEPKPKH